MKSKIHNILLTLALLILGVLLVGAGGSILVSANNSVFAEVGGLLAVGGLILLYIAYQLLWGDN